MNKRILLIVGCAGCLAGSLTQAGPPPKETPVAQKKGAAGSANPTNTEVEIPLSSFALPASPKDGKDPFFPTSKRPYAGVIKSAPTPTNVPVNLVLNGITKGLAMINGRTFAEGEEGDVPTSSGGKKHIRCLKIKEESIIIEMLPEGERQELKMRGGA